MKPFIENQKRQKYMLPIIKTIQQFFQFFMRFLDNGNMYLQWPWPGPLDIVITDTRVIQ